MYIKLAKRLSEKDIRNAIKKLEDIGFPCVLDSLVVKGILNVNCTFKDEERIIEVLESDYVGMSIYKHTAHFNTKVEIKNMTINVKQNEFMIIGGPCSIEGEEQIISIVDSIKDNVSVIRGGGFKPRTSPYDFQGLKTYGIELLSKFSQGKPIICEIVSTGQISYFVEKVDIIQVGARNMQNFELLKALGKTNKPIMLKRGLSATINEWINAAEYIMIEGNKNVILCERGIRTFEEYTRNTLDISAVVAAKKLTCLPVFVDPSHASGKWWMIDKLSKVALAAGADGVIIEVHNDPENAMSDGPQSLLPEKFNQLVDELRELAPHFNKKVL